MQTLKDRVAEANGRLYDCDAATIVKLIECRDNGVEYIKSVLKLYEDIKKETEEEAKAYEEQR